MLDIPFALICSLKSGIPEIFSLISHWSVKFLNKTLVVTV